MQKSISFENLETAQDIRYIRTQFPVLLSRMMCKLLMLAQKKYFTFRKYRESSKYEKFEIETLIFTIKSLRFYKNFSKTIKSSNLSRNFNRQYLILYQQQKINKLSQSASKKITKISAVTKTK